MPKGPAPRFAFVICHWLAGLNGRFESGLQEAALEQQRHRTSARRSQAGSALERRLGGERAGGAAVGVDARSAMLDLSEMPCSLRRQRAFRRSRAARTAAGLLRSPLSRAVRARECDGLGERLQDKGRGRALQMRCGAVLRAAGAVRPTSLLVGSAFPLFWCGSCRCRDGAMLNMATAGS